MILVRSPLRISLGGGGTDLPSYYSQEGGFVLSGAINKYVYVGIVRPFFKGIFLKYSNLEKCQNLDDIKHPLFREILRSEYPEVEQIEISTLADVPAGTGLGSSGSFATGLIKCLAKYLDKDYSPEELAERACDVEINILGEPVGKQDQYISALGGLTSFTFNKNGTVSYDPIAIDKSEIKELGDRLLLFFTGKTRSASDILREQKVKSDDGNAQMISNLNFIKQLGLESKNALEKSDFSDFGRLMNIHWEYKKKRASGMSDEKVDQCYERAMQNGALGGKLVGAGGGGFLMFLVDNPQRVRGVCEQFGYEEMPFEFVSSGASTIEV